MIEMLRVAIIAASPLALTLTARQEALSNSDAAPVEDLPFLPVGRVAGDELYLHGPLIGDPREPGASLRLAWFLPDEEGEGGARPIDLSEASVTIKTLPRKKAEPDRRWRCRLESGRPSRSVFFFAGGFLPPFRAADVSLVIEHLINYNYDGYVLSGLLYGRRPPDYMESDWPAPRLESESCLL